jgi:hypothetical protein
VVSRRRRSDSSRRSASRIVLNRHHLRVGAVSTRRVLRTAASA